jgi:type I restriction enzyme S subunit
MSKIDDLIKQYCPDGVEFKELGEIGTLYGGLTGKSRGDFTDGNARFITYVSIFNNIVINTSDTGFVKVGEHERQKQVQIGDVLFTGSSETPDECGMSSVLTQEPDEPLYLNSFCFGFRPNDASLLLPDFSKYLFRDTTIRKQITKSASGVTRFNISKKRFIKIKVPIPPIEVQREIANILDKFTSLEAELEAELEARKKQYEFYRNQLLSFDELGGALWTTLGEVAMYSKARIEAANLNADNYVGVDNILQNRQGKTTSSYVPTSGNLTQFDSGDVLLGNIRPYLKKIWHADKTGGTNGDVLVIKLTDESITPRYLYQVLSDDRFFDYEMQRAKGAKMPRGDKASIMRYPVPVPPIAEQNRIVSILDKFDTLVHDITEGLPAEIAARLKQYEYYRNKLLTFRELSA